VLSGLSKGKRLLSVEETEQFVMLGAEMKDTGNRAFAAKDFEMALTRYTQVRRTQKAREGGFGRSIWGKGDGAWVHPTKIHRVCAFWMCVWTGCGAAEQCQVPGGRPGGADAGPKDQPTHQPGTTPTPQHTK
jgi:hypothetical protein